MNPVVRSRLQIGRLDHCAAEESPIDDLSILDLLMRHRLVLSCVCLPCVEQRQSIADPWMSRSDASHQCQPHLFMANSHTLDGKQATEKFRCVPRVVLARTS
jgi:hypothetical protein